MEFQAASPHQFFTEVHLTPAQFVRVAGLAHRWLGLKLRSGKESLVESRLACRLRALGLADYGSYLDLIEQDEAGAERRRMMNLLTTNLTSFFREASHFDFLRSVVASEMRDKPLRLWCAGCSTGQEAYTMALTLCEALPDMDRRDARILATDISTDVLQKAKRGVYELAGMTGVPPLLRQKYFKAASPTSYEVIDDVKALVKFACLNLVGEWPMRGPFDVIFCRNVMIYFDDGTKEKVVARLAKLIRPGGYLFIGQSESLTGTAHQLHYVRPAVYRV